MSSIKSASVPARLQSLIAKKRRCTHDGFWHLGPDSISAPSGGSCPQTLALSSCADGEEPSGALDAPSGREPVRTGDHVGCRSGTLGLRPTAAPFPESAETDR